MCKLYDNMRCMGNFRDNRSGGGRNFGRRSFGGDRGGDREMHSAVCSNCGKNCEVPFEPTGSKPVYCFDCFKKMGGGGRDSRRNDSRPQNNEQLDAINRKVDKILELLTKVQTPVKEKKEIKAKPEKVVEKI